MSAPFETSPSSRPSTASEVAAPPSRNLSSASIPRSTQSRTSRRVSDVSDAMQLIKELALDDGGAGGVGSKRHSFVSPTAAGAPLSPEAARRAAHLRSIIPPIADELLHRAMLTEEKIRSQVRRTLPRQIEDERKQMSRLLSEMRAHRAALAKSLAQCDAGFAEQLAMEQDAMRERQSALKPEGFQMHDFGNGDYYEGEWKNSTVHGHGKWITQDGTLEYIGGWFLGMRNGSGSLQCATTRVSYHGPWADGLRHGRGEQQEPSGVYKGEFQLGIIAGLGEYTFAHDGSVYKGQWEAEAFHGNGLLTFQTGVVYEGQWRNGLRHGKGTLDVKSLGERYVGEWSHGVRSGAGVQTTKEFNYDGLWANNVREGQGDLRLTSGEVYVGEFHHDKPHGKGTWTGARGADHYSGEWRSGRPHGRGVYTRGKHLSFEGDWRNGRRHGEGWVVNANAGKLHIPFVDDEPHGEGVFFHVLPPDGPLTTLVPPGDGGQLDGFGTDAASVQSSPKGAPISAGGVGGATGPAPTLQHFDSLRSSRPPMAPMSVATGGHRAGPVVPSPPTGGDELSIRSNTGGGGPGSYRVGSHHGTATATAASVAGGGHSAGGGGMGISDAAGNPLSENSATGSISFVRFERGVCVSAIKEYEMLVADVRLEASRLAAMSRQTSVLIEP